MMRRGTSLQRRRQHSKGRIVLNPIKQTEQRSLHDHRCVLHAVALNPCLEKRNVCVDARFARLRATIRDAILAQAVKFYGLGRPRGCIRMTSICCTLPTLNLYQQGPMVLNSLTSQNVEILGKSSQGVWKREARQV